MPTLRRLPLADQAAELMLDRVRTGTWPLDHRLPGEQALAAELGVGRSTVREAIRQLAGKGVLESRQGSGVYVVRAEASEDWEEVLRRGEVVDVLEVRGALETEAARLAATRRTPADLRALATALAGRGEVPATASAQEYVDADLVFHRAVVDAAHNAVLTDLFATFVPRLRRAMVDMIELDGAGERHRHDQDAHEAILDAVRDRDADRAAASSRRHLDAVHAKATHEPLDARGRRA
ncbi:FadR/GntR family transcriptional regulator [Oerskovia paurometabola]|uniref:FadR/GntR family transcriptional regulator n=1 Tax=Oerskovia paurometabola TaxID=162170 RepID=A0ABW1XDP0_9CELL|nr:FCD domain-containing protein [Oerskovia paurometabola]MBM7497113.1 DNA-binding FadR family transcriptional regulator [Oerskovia paurometabola]